MVQKPKSVKYKVVLGYVLLFCTAVASIWFFYTEILKIAVPKTDDDSATIIKISTTIADLYASEAVGRSAILTLSDEDHGKYDSMIDSINGNIESIKKDIENSQKIKFDSIQLLLQRKKSSITEIIQFRKKNSPEKTYTTAINGIYTAKDSILSLVKPVKTEDRYEWQKLVSSLLTPSQMDSLSKLPVSNDSLALAFDNILTSQLVKDTKQRYQLNRKEEKLLDENRIISDQLRIILSSIENEFLKKSYTKIKESQNVISNTINKMAWIGAVAFFFLIVFAWIIIRDITSNQNYRKQLELLNNENESLLRSKSILMATVTHDLQTPLGSIIGFHNLLKQSGITTKQQQYLDNIKESADYILKLVNDLLDFSRLENNKITVENKAFNMKKLIETTCQTLEPIATNKNIELNWDIEEELNHSFLSDSYRLKQVLTNLISNSIKFTAEGSVEVVAKQEGENIQIAVIDTGIGIAKNKQEDIFKEFTQAHSDIEKKFGGTGLGLTISKKIVELMNGTITLESEEGHGSIFTITLPCTLCNEEESVIQSDVNDSIINLIKERKILVVDDDDMQLALMRELFLNYGIHITTENNPKNIINLLEQEKQDLVLTDIQMPLIGGFELVKLIRKNYTAEELPVIALSGRRDLSEEEYTSAGFYAHHPKPVQFTELLALISTALGNTAVVKTTTPGTPNPNIPNRLYNLNSLMQFTQNDTESLKKIITTFIISARENCSALLHAAEERNEQKMSETAHKMIPMLKQMEVYSIAGLLEPLEGKTLGLHGKELLNYIDTICQKTENLIAKLEEEINYKSIL